MQKQKLYIGTSGWHYKHWIGTFYPGDIKESRQFSYYLKDFSSVELNNPFYRLPSKETFTNWRLSVPEGFLFSVKASRYITHMKKLKDPKESVKQFFDHVKMLREKLGPILFQLPPRWKINKERLEEFLKVLPKKYRYVFEFRNTTWYEDEIFELLKKYNCAFCIYELNGHTTPLAVTADFVYIRLHGPGAKYKGSYSKTILKKWKQKCSEWLKQNKDVFIYFDNDQEGYAAFNAKELKAMSIKE